MNGRGPPGDVLHDLQDDVALPREDRLGVLAGLQGECLVLKQLGQLAALVLAQVAALRRRRSVAEAASPAAQNRRPRAAGPQCRPPWPWPQPLWPDRRPAARDQNLAQPLALRLRVILLVLLVVALHFARRDLDVLANLLPHHFLGDDLVADVGFEVLERDALLLGGLFQVLDRGQVVLLADLVQPLHQLGFAGNAQFLALGEPQLLVDQVAQQILVRRRHLLHGLAVLPAPPGPARPCARS